MLGDVQCECRLAHRWPRGEDDEVALLQAGGHAVEVIKAGADTGDFFGAIAVEFIDAVEQRFDQRCDAHEADAPARAFFTDAQDLRLGIVKDQ